MNEVSNVRFTPLFILFNGENFCDGVVVQKLPNQTKDFLKPDTQLAANFLL